MPELSPPPLPSTGRPQNQRQPKARQPKEREDEFELLCLLSGRTLSAERFERFADSHWTSDLSSIARTNQDRTEKWTEFLRLAEHHGVLPLAARNLVEHVPTETGRDLPPEIERSLRSVYEANLRRNLWFSVELARIMRHFESRQVSVIPYKGPVLAQSLYGDIGLRSFSDLDFLVSPADFERAKQAFAEIDYCPSSEHTPAIERLWLRIGYERSFCGDAGKNLVELQWALLPHFYAVDFHRGDLGVESLLQRAGRAEVGGCEVPCLSPEDSLLALCLHASKHLWTRLIWLSDIAATLRLPVIDYTLVFSRARKLGIARILGVSFWLVKNVLREELPTIVEKTMAEDPQVASLGREIADRLTRGTPYDFESTEYFRLIMRLRERRRDRWRYLWRLVWTPGVGDVLSVRLPEALFPLYRVVRIGRLLRKSMPFG